MKANSLGDDNQNSFETVGMCVEDDTLTRGLFTQSSILPCLSYLRVTSSTKAQNLHLVSKTPRGDLLYLCVHAAKHRLGNATSVSYLLYTGLCPLRIL